MSSFLSIFTILIISFSSFYTNISQNLPVFGAIFHFEGSVPNLGIINEKLSPCPPSPNCVVSEEYDDSHYIAPLKYESDRQTAYNTFIKILSVVPDTKIVEKKEDYIRIESRSKIMGFVDDGEFYFPLNQNVIYWRSASRLGDSDLGVNRRRLEQIRLAFEDFNR